MTLHPLSAFQRTMLRWDRLYPYNAVHAVQMRGAAHVAALQAAVAAVCGGVGLGTLHIDRRRRRFAYAPVDVPIVVNHRTPAAGAESLCAALCAGLQHPFPPGAHHPLHWSVLADATGAAHWIVLAYHHVVADASAVAALLVEVVNRYTGRTPLAAPPALGVVPPPAALALDPPLRLTRLPADIGRMLQTFRRMKFAHKMPDERIGGDRTDCVLRPAPAGLFERLAARCRARGVGFNDACFGAFASAIAERTPDRHTSRRRRKIALGGVINLRRRAPVDLSGYFGVCLGDMLVLLDDPDADVDAVIQQAAARTRAQKLIAGQAAGAAALTTFFVERVWPLFLIPHNRRSYRKLLPLCGGVSPFLVDAERFGPAADSVLGYVRACPTGPAAPLLLAPTVFRGQLTFTLTHRLTCMDRAAAVSLLARTLALLVDWCQTD